MRAGGSHPGRAHANRGTLLLRRASATWRPPRRPGGVVGLLVGRSVDARPLYSPTARRGTLECRCKGAPGAGV
eukprot:4492444-Alexandrium_andersonii.AAC.1